MSLFQIVYILLHIKLIGKGIQEKLRSYNIVSIKLRFLQTE